MAGMTMLLVALSGYAGDGSQVSSSEAERSQVNVSEADVSEANQSEANVSEANVSEADLSVASEAKQRVSEAGHFVLRFAPPEDLTINEMHAWRVHVENAARQPVENARITVSGGMPIHDHGLPTAPRVTRDLGNGDYLIEGVRFHMLGQWQITLTVAAEGVSDSATFDFEL